MRLAVCTPTQSLWTPEYGHSLAQTMAELQAEANGIEAVAHSWVDGTIIADVRSDLAQHALDSKATHILWTDCDMRFRPEHVRKLIEHSELDIVGTNYIQRMPPHHPIAVALDGQYVVPKPSGLEKVLYTGMGLMLTKVSVFERLPKPWFFQPFSEELQRPIGEDLWFCRYAKDHGIDTWLDHGASIGLGHVAKDVLTIEVESIAPPKPKLELVH